MTYVRNRMGFIVALFVLNNGAAASGQDFETRKSECLAEIELQIQRLHEHKNCVISATSYESLRKCGDIMRAWKKGVRLGRRGNREFLNDDEKRD